MVMSCLAGAGRRIRMAGDPAVLDQPLAFDLAQAIARQARFLTLIPVTDSESAVRYRVTCSPDERPGSLKRIVETADRLHLDAVFDSPQLVFLRRDDA